MGRVLLALIVLELRRGRVAMLTLLGVTVLALLPALLLDGLAPVIIGAVAVMFGLGSIFAPVGDLLQDRALGHLEGERMLPWPRRLLAAGRLAGATCRLLPAALTIVPLGITLGREADAGALTAMVLPPVTLLVWALMSLVAWLLLGLNARWQLRRLWWIPLLLWTTPGFLLESLPPATKAAIERWFEPRFYAAGEWIATPTGVITIAVLAVALVVTGFAVAAWLYAAGLDRFRADTSGVGEDLGRAPTRELGTAGHGVTLAIARLRLRVASEQLRREAIILAVVFAVIAFGGGGLRRYAQIYLPVLATIIPGGIVGQLLAMRTTGDLEALQQLPHPAWRVALGHLLAIAALAVPGALVIHAGRYLDDRAVTVGAVAASWCWFVGGTWLAAAVSLFLRRIHFLIALGVVLLLVLLSRVTGLGPALATMVGTLRTFHAGTGALLPSLVAMGAMVIGVPMFARGLSRYRKV